MGDYQYEKNYILYIALLLTTGSPNMVFTNSCKDATDVNNKKDIKKFQQNLEFFESHWMSNDKLYISYKVKPIDINGYVPCEATQVIVLTYNKGDKIPEKVNGTCNYLYVQGNAQAQAPVNNTTEKQSQEPTSKTQDTLSNITDGTIIVRYKFNGKIIYPVKLLAKQPLDKEIVISSENVKGYKPLQKNKTVKLSKQNPNISIEFSYEKTVNEKLIIKKVIFLIFIVLLLLSAVFVNSKKNKYNKGYKQR